MTGSSSLPGLRRLRAHPGVVGPDRFWDPWIRTASTTTLKHTLDQCEATGRLANFDRAARRRADAFVGRVYDDSDVYKVLEGAAYALARHPDAELAQRVEALVARIAAAPAPDGYLHTWTQTHAEARPFENLRDRHELYCAGHLLEAACALASSAFGERLWPVARRALDPVRATFGPQGRRDVPGHPEIELALLRWAESGGPTWAVDLARFFLETRGTEEGRTPFGETHVDLAPIRAQKEVAGHAVRASYLLAAAADLVRLGGDDSWWESLGALWKDCVERRMYVTGGIGSAAANEGFTRPYDLPDEESYAETCAGIGLAIWAHRLALLHGDARYADVLELAVHNAVLAGLARRGDRFFYSNPLASQGQHERRSWFDCACCPTNLVRFLPGLGRYLAALGEPGQGDVAGRAFFLNLYVTSRFHVLGADVRVETDLPWHGHVRLTIEAPRPLELSLALRVPGWARDARLCVDDVPAPLRLQEGYAWLDRTWQGRSVVDLELALETVRVRSDPRVASARGRVALRRGPLVYAVEGIDHPGACVHDLVLPVDASLTLARAPGELGDLPALESEAREGSHAGARAVPLRAIPYAAWQNRGRGDLRVWIRESAT